MTDELQLIVQEQGVSRGSDGTRMRMRGLRGGEVITSTYERAASLEGRVFAANMGTLDTPLTFLAYAANRPDAWLRVPTGTKIIPVSVQVVLATSAGTATKVYAIAAQNDIGNGTSSAATVGPISLHTLVPNSSNVVGRQLATADTTAMTNPIELWRKHFAVADAAGDDRSPIWVPTAPPVLVGPASLIVYVSATTTQATGHVIFTWIELAT